jgi:hypothetical protein
MRAALAFAVLLVVAPHARAESIVKPDFDDDADVRVRELIDRVLATYGYSRAPSPGECCGHIDVDGGGDLLIIVEPIDGATRKTIAQRGPKGTSDVMWWDESRPQRIARAFPMGRFTLHNPVGDVQQFELWRGKKLWRRVEVGAHADLEVRDLPEGILRVRRVGGEVDGWVYVTPWPSRVMRTERHETFAVPNGRYRLHGWHPRGGERSVVVVAN